jgi:hypothetical protein
MVLTNSLAAASASGLGDCARTGATRRSITTKRPAIAANGIRIKILLLKLT